jgi:hypothetical protein
MNGFSSQALTVRAFSGQVDTGWPKENATKQ